MSVEEQLFKASQDLVAQADANLKLAQQYRATSDKLAVLAAEEAEACNTAIQAIAGPDSDPERYKGVPLEDLLAMKPEQDGVRAASAESGPRFDLAATPAQVEIQKLEELQRAIQARIESLSKEIEEASAAVSDMDAMRQVVHESAERFRFEKDHRAKAFADLQAANEKVEYLSEHIEKMMNHLKHEAAAKVKTYSVARSFDGELESLRNKNAILAQRNATREKVITELKEGSRILEDQLRLMDDKYNELRSKLEATRSASTKDVKRAQAKADRLQACMSDEEVEPQTISALAGDVESSDDDEKVVTSPMPVLFLSHGAGPSILTTSELAPQLEGMDKSSDFAKFYAELAETLPKPNRIVIVSAHWVEEEAFKLTSTDKQFLHFDYFGFSPDAYDVNYSPPGDPKFARKLAKLLHAEGLPTKLTLRRGLDHGAFIPLSVLFPTARIPVVQISLRANMNMSEHVLLGRTLAQFRCKGTMIICSGQATHNYKTFGDYGVTPPKPWAEEFVSWLTATLTEASEEERVRRMSAMYEEAPHAARAHPSADHIMPAVVMAGALSVLVAPNDEPGWPVVGAKVYDGWVRETLSLACYVSRSVRPKPVTPVLVPEADAAAGRRKKKPGRGGKKK